MILYLYPNTIRFMILFLSVFFFIFLAFLSIILWTWKNGISPMPTTVKAKKILLSNLPEKIEGTIYELGSGWGTLAFALADKYPHCKIIGYENSHVPFLFSKIKQYFSKKDNLVFKRKDFFIVGLENSTMIVCYLYPKAMQRLKAKFETELREGTWVISHTFSIPNWKAYRCIDIHDIYHSKIYIYRR